MFLQEILNAELRNKYIINFIIYDYFPSCFKKIMKCCSIECCIPANYKPDPTSGTLLEEILDFNYINNSSGINDEELYHFYKRYKNKIRKIDRQDKFGMFNDLYCFVKNINIPKKNLKIY